MAELGHKWLPVPLSEVVLLICKEKQNMYIMWKICGCLVSWLVS